jgi:uncharacterized protein (DUF924 family)
MEEPVSHVIERAYRVFAKYPRRTLADTAESECSDTTVLDAIEQGVEGKALKDLSENDLDDYFFLAINHVGTGEDFKHFLPRILEFVARSPYGGFANALLSRLSDARVAEWPYEEREIIGDFFRTKPEVLGRYGSPQDIEKLVGIAWRDT